jgi:hypothetical protein
MKRKYTVPKVMVHGTVEEITQAAAINRFLNQHSHLNQNNGSPGSTNPTAS